jgi:hypothetical protein
MNGDHLSYLPGVAQSVGIGQVFYILPNCNEDQDFFAPLSNHASS